METVISKKHSIDCDVSDRLQHSDALYESLEKIQALTRVLMLGCSSFGESENDSHTLQWVLTAILEQSHIANHSWKTLENIWQDKTRLLMRGVRIR